MLQSPGVSSNSAPAGAAATALFSLPITKYGSPEVPGHVLWAAVEPPAPRQCVHRKHPGFGWAHAEPRGDALSSPSDVSVTLKGRGKVKIAFEKERAGTYRASDGVGGRMWRSGTGWTAASCLWPPGTNSALRAL